MLQGLVDAFGVVFEWPNPLWIIGGVLFGMLIGFLPGMAGSVALALLIPLTFSMEPDDAILFLIAAYSPAGFGGMLTSILVNTPGDPANAATTFDGYPMAKQGRAAGAIGAATAASVLGGLVGTVVLIALIPLAKEFILFFSYPEFFMMAILGLCVIAVVTERNTFKGLVAAGVGFMLAFIGLDPITGSPRFTFDQLYLIDGLDISVVLIGLFAGAEVVALFAKGQSVASDAAMDVNTGSGDRRGTIEEPITFWDGIRSTIAHWFLLIRSSLIGTVVGVVPGVGGAVSGFLAYSHAKQSSKRRDRFGKGAVEGVIAAESANDAKEGGSLLPTVAFGIPATVGMAVLLGALIMHGVPAGPTLMVDNPEIVYVLIVGMVVSKLIAPIVVWLVAGQAPRFTRMRPGLLTPLIAVAALVGAYTINLEVLDVAMALVFGYVGYAMRRYGYSRVALIIALVLGELVERSYYQMDAALGGPSAILGRPIAGALLLAAVLVLGLAVVQAYRRTRRTAVAALDPEDEEELAVQRRQAGRIVFDVVLLAFTAVLVREAMGITTDAAVLPLLIGIPAVVALSIQLAMDLEPRLGVLARRLVARTRRGARAPSTPGTAPEEAMTGPSRRPDGGRSVIAGAIAQEAIAERAEETEERKDASDRQVLLRQVTFGLWAVGFAVLGALVGFTWAIPIGLLFFLLVLAKEKVLLSVLVTTGAWAALYGLFGVALGVPLG